MISLWYWKLVINLRFLALFANFVIFHCFRVDSGSDSMRLNVSYHFLRCVALGKKESAEIIRTLFILIKNYLQFFANIARMFLVGCWRNSRLGCGDIRTGCCGYVGGRFLGLSLCFDIFYTCCLVFGVSAW